jgi:hypothetical protein
MALVGVSGALLAPAVAAADYDLSVRWNVPTTGVSETTANGVTTFRATAPGAVLSVDDVGNAVLAGNDIAIESGDGTGAIGSITTDRTPLGEPGIGVAFTTNGPLHFGDSIQSEDLSIQAGGAVTQDLMGNDTYDLMADDATDISAGGPVTLPGLNRFGVLTLHTTSTQPSLVGAADPMALSSSSVAGPLTVLAMRGLDLDGTIITGGATTLVGDANPPLAPQIGDGDVTAEPGTTIDAAGHPVQLWSAERDLDHLGPDLTINGARYVPGTVLLNSATETWGQRWSASAAPPSAVPFQFVYEAGDYQPPTAVLGLPRGAQRYALNQVVHVPRACADTGGSGLASCIATGLTAGDDLDTSTGGAHTVTLTAVDGAGNQTVASRSYSVTVPPVLKPPVARRPATRKPCVTPTSVTLKIARPKGTRSVVATLAGKRQKVKLSKTRIAITVNVRGRARGTYALKVTIRRGHGRRTVTRRPKVTVYKCVGSHGG